MNRRTRFGGWTFGGMDVWEMKRLDYLRCNKTMGFYAKRTSVGWSSSGI